MAKTASRKTDPDGRQLDFEAALNRLEEIVEQLDDGNVPLAQSLALFKEGTTLAKRCRDLLSSADLAVKEALRDVRDGEQPQDDDGAARAVAGERPDDDGEFVDEEDGA